MTKQKKMPKINPLKTEREMSDFTNFLANQNFSTIEEANEFLQKTDPKVLSRLAKRKTKTKDEEAFDLVASACDESPEKGLEMVKKALEIDPDCADAYLFLANKTKDIDEAIELSKKAMTGARKKLGEDVFKNDVGHFWGIVETRPYMRAKAGYAELLQLKKNYDAAVKEYQELLELNPNDNQGNRDMLSCLLLQINRWRDYEQLYQKYPDEFSTLWLYNRALFLYIRYGGVPRTIEALNQAVECNPHVLDILTGKKEPKLSKSDYYTVGSFEEASFYFSLTCNIWVKYPKAFRWMMIRWRLRENLN